MWIKEAVAGQRQTVIEEGRSPSNFTNAFQSYINTNGTFAFADYNGSYGFNDYTNSATNTSEWDLIGFVKNGTSGKFFFNGDLDKSVTGAVNISYVDNDFVIGREYRDSVYPFHGFMDDVRVYGRALSASEIKALYDAAR